MASPITDPSCSEPGNKLDTSYTYANLQIRAYYQTTKTIRSLLPASGAGSSAPLMSLDQNGQANQVAMTLFAATSKPADASGATVLCNNTNTVGGGSVAAITPATADACADGSFYNATTMCPPWCVPQPYVSHCWLPGNCGCAAAGHCRCTAGLTLSPIPLLLSVQPHRLLLRWWYGNGVRRQHVQPAAGPEG